MGRGALETKSDGERRLKPFQMLSWVALPQLGKREEAERVEGFLSGAVQGSSLLLDVASCVNESFLYFWKITKRALFLVFILAARSVAC